MPFTSSFRRLAATAALTFAAALALALTADDGRPARAPAAAAPAGADGTAGEIRRLQSAVRADPDRAALYPALASAYLQRARETGDPAFYERAERLLARGAATDPAVAVQRGRLALARHDFRAALRDARTARRLAPGSLEPYPVLVDALVELGRHRRAARALQRMVDLKPTLAGYARAAYLRELHGDLPGAADALRLAASAGGPAREHVAYVHALLGEVELARGRTAAARRAFDTAAAYVPKYLPAAAGRARLAARRGDVAGAIRRWRAIVARRPLPEYAVALGEAELAAGRRAAARRDLALVRAHDALLGDAGVDTDAERALYEADHGDAGRALRLARRARAAAPGLRADDALGWALTRAGRPEAGLAWARRALRLGSLDPGFRFHAGMSALAAGRQREGRRQLRLALRHGLAASPWQARRARRALGGRTPAAAGR